MKLIDIDTLNKEIEVVIFKFKKDELTKEEALINFEDILKKIALLLGKKNEKIKELEVRFKRLLFIKKKHNELKENLQKLQQKESILFMELGLLNM